MPIRVEQGDHSEPGLGVEVVVPDNIISGEPPMNQGEYLNCCGIHKKDTRLSNSYLGVVFYLTWAFILKQS